VFCLSASVAAAALLASGVGVSWRDYAVPANCLQIGILLASWQLPAALPGEVMSVIDCILRAKYVLQLLVLLCLRCHMIYRLWLILGSCPVDVRPYLGSSRKC
jgi:hypothetical protein